MQLEHHAAAARQSGAHSAAFGHLACSRRFPRLLKDPRHVWPVPYAYSRRGAGQSAFLERGSEPDARANCHEARRQWRQLWALSAYRRGLQRHQRASLISKFRVGRIEIASPPRSTESAGLHRRPLLVQRFDRHRSSASPDNRRLRFRTTVAPAFAPSRPAGETARRTPACSHFTSDSADPYPPARRSLGSLSAQDTSWHRSRHWPAPNALATSAETGNGARVSSAPAGRRRGPGCVSPYRRAEKNIRRAGGTSESLSANRCRAQSRWPATQTEDRPSCGGNSLPA